MSKKSGKELHPLFNSWAHARRVNKICDEWKNNFWLFVAHVGDRPEDCRITTKDPNKKLSVDNFEWVKIKQKLSNFKSRAEYMRVYMGKNRDKQKNADLKKRFGITYDRYKELEFFQDNKCAICGCSETSIDRRTKQIRALAVDHCHTTGRIRGLLCTTCNQGIGSLKDNIALLERAIEYLKK